MITSMHIKAGDQVDLWDAVDERVVTMHSVDAAHALQVDPDRYLLEKPEPEPVVEETTTERDPSEFGGESAL